MSDNSIMLVDDDSGARETLSAILADWGYSPKAFEKGLEAIQAFEKDPTDLLLVDIKLPDISGLEILQRVRERNPDVAILIMTGYASVENAIHAMNRGAMAYITKPINMEELKVLLKKASREVQLAQENKHLIDRLQFTNHDLDKANKELKQTQNKLIQAEKMAALGELGAGAAHELNNPLAGIMGFTEAIIHDLKSGSVDPVELKHDLEIIFQDAHRCKTIVSNILNFAVAKKVTMVECDTDSLIDEAISMVARQSSLQNINIIKEYGQDVPKVYVDKDQITRVLINIILNAQKAMPRGGDIRIKTGHEKDFITIELKDTGIGIEAENLHKVFDPFFTTYRPGQGIGLGLSVSYGIVKSHGGELDAYSEGKNKGASFIVRLPV